MQNIHDHLSNLAQQAGSTTIVYHGGSQPGSMRQIAPLIVTDTVAHARDLVTDEIKTFVLAKIEFVPEADAVVEYTRQPVPVAKASLLASAVDPYLVDLQKLGWKVTLTDDFILLHPRHNDRDDSGTATIGLRRSDVESSKTRLGKDSAEQDAAIPDDSWYVFGPHFAQFIVVPEVDPAQPYRRLANAVRFFIAQARECAPRKRLA